MADHIQIPQTWMRNFQHRDNGECVYSLWLNSGNITSEKIKSLGAEKNYYTKDFEHHLDVQWETRLGLFFEKTKKNYRNDEKMELSEDDILFLKRFLAISVSRSKTYQALDCWHSNRKIPYLGYREIPILSVEASNGILFENYSCRFLFNTSNIGFVLPSYSICYTYHDKIIFPLMIINDKIAILFDKCGKTNSYSISDELLTRDVNRWAFITECYTNHDFIIASKENDLITLRSDIIRLY